MKWWHWLILELLIIFGVIAWIYFFPSENEDDFAKGMIGFGLICVIEEHKNINRRRTNKMKKIKGYNIVKEKTNELLVSIEVGSDEVIEKDGYKVIPFYEEGNPTIEQNAGENRIEGGVLSLSVAPKHTSCSGCEYEDKDVYTEEPCKSCTLARNNYTQKQEKQYRPFKNCDELCKYWHDEKARMSTFNNSKSLIWVKHKEYRTDNLIIAFDNDNESIGGSCVFIQDIWVDMKELFDNFTFLDGSLCGFEEK